MDCVELCGGMRVTGERYGISRGISVEEILLFKGRTGDAAADVL